MRLVVEPQHAGLRLDQLLAVAGGLSRRRARALIAAGAVRRNGETTRVQGRQVGALDVIEVATALAATPAPPGAPAPSAAAPPATSGEPPALPVLFHDDWLLAVDKPAGVLSQPAERRAADDPAMDELAARRLAWELGRPPFLRLVHRLDRVTSGVLLFARSAAALPPLAAAWREGRVERHYVAVVEGELPAGARTVEAAIARDATAAWRFLAVPAGAGGRAATTEVETLAAGAGRSLVRCRLHTGRTHQVRVHLAFLGHPVAGDRLYGATTDAPRPLLHAASVRLPHPRDGREITVEAPLPADLVTAAAGLRAAPAG